MKQALALGALACSCVLLLSKKFFVCGGEVFFAGAAIKFDHQRDHLMLVLCEAPPQGDDRKSFVLRVRETVADGGLTCID